MFKVKGKIAIKGKFQLIENKNIFSRKCPFFQLKNQFSNLLCIMPAHFPCLTNFIWQIKFFSNMFCLEVKPTTIPISLSLFTLNVTYDNQIQALHSFVAPSSKLDRTSWIYWCVVSGIQCFFLQSLLLTTIFFPQKTLFIYSLIIIILFLV